MINEEIIYNYVKNNNNISEENIVNMIYYDSPVAITKQQIVQTLHHLVEEKRLVMTNNGSTKYTVINNQ